MLLRFNTRVVWFRWFAVCLALLAGGLASAPAQTNWPRWRGPQDNNSIENGVYPIKWDAEHVLWKAPLPGKGCSTPMIWQQRIYVTAPVNGRDALLALDWSGQLLWQTVFDGENPGKNPHGSGCNPTPTTDGQAVFVYFKSGTLAAVDLGGKVRWRTNLVARYGSDTLYWDHGTSPVLTERYVVMTRMHHGESWLAAFDKASGELSWKVARNYVTATEGDHGYSTPVVIRHRGQEALLVWGGEHLTAHDTTDGSLFWSCGDFNPANRVMWPAITSPTLIGDIAIIATGRNDKNEPRLHGIRLGGASDVTATHRVWKREDTGPFVPSPCAYQGRLYLLRDRGEVECLEPATGKTIWRDTLPRDRSNYYASPLIASGQLYAAREDGVVFVARVGDRFELLAENKMGESIIASPVAVSNRLFLRGEKHLFCVTAP